MRKSPPITDLDMRVGDAAKSHLPVQAIANAFHANGPEDFGLDVFSGAGDGLWLDPIDDVFGDANYAYAKPAHAGGGGGGGGKGGGKGKIKDQPDDSGTTDPTDPTDPTGGTGGSTGGGGFGWTSATDYTSGGDTPDGFNIALSFEGSGWTDEYKQVVTDAAELLSDIIYMDIPDYGGVDDVHFRVILNDIDGSGGILGVGGSLADRPDSSLPYESFIRLDASDIAAQLGGNLNDIVFHELLHGLGFGTEWQEMGLIDTIGGEPRFIGQNAIAAYNAFFPNVAAADQYSDQGVPLSGDGAHWDHGDFTNEIMTPSLYPSNNVVSEMTLAALEDMGYETVYPDDPGEDPSLMI